MTKFKRLTRGIKLLRDHVFDPLSSSIDLLTKTGLPIENYDKENGTFRVALTFPLVPEPASSSTPITAPFILPPLQDTFDLSSYLIEGYQLLEVAVSQDTRCEPAYLSDDGGGIVTMGEAASFSLFIREHPIDASNYDPFSTEVYSLKVPEIALINEYSRFNPFVQSGMAIPFRHDRAYLIELIRDEARAMLSVCISLKFKTLLVSRDTGIQNDTPQASRSFVPQAPVIPAENSPIEADGADGVNTGFKVADEIINAKLAGGYGRSGSSNYAEGLNLDAAYDVIAVPMFGMWGSVRGGAGFPANFGGITFQSAASMPWAAPGVGNFQTMDRALVQLQYPIAIHHVILAVNNTAGPDVRRLTTDPTRGANVANEVGIGLLSGVRSDNVEIKQIAHANWTPATIGNYLIDRGDYSHEDSTDKHSGYSWDMLSCPIPIGASGAGTGYKAQGKPMFAAQGESNVLPRAFPITVGAEQVLDIRWKISDSVSDVVTWPATPNEVILGYRGHWIYLICKKTLR